LRGWNGEHAERTKRENRQLPSSRLRPDQIVAIISVTDALLV